MARSLSLLEICTEAMEGITGFNIPTTIIGNADDDTALALKRAAKTVGRELATQVRWQALLSATPHSFTTVNGTANYDLPSDFQAIANGTVWDRTNDWQLLGPATRKIWQNLQSATISAGVRYWYRVGGNYFSLYPTPTAANTIVYDYYSRNYCTDSGGTAKEDWTSDTDLSRIDGELFIKGVTYYFKKGKELPFAEEKSDYLASILAYQSDDTPKAGVDFGANNPLVDIGIGNIPDTGFGA